MLTTAIASTLVAAIAGTAAWAARRKPTPGSKADKTAAAILGGVMAPLGGMLIWQ